MTKKFGIIGNPIKHSLSPVLHNYWFEKYSIDANYSLINIEESELPEIVKKIKDKTLDGINITLPYKQKIVPFLDVLVNDAQITSSVNTLYLSDGTITGEHGIGLQKKSYLLKEHPDNLPVMKSIKRSLDANNIMNPGKVFDLN